MRTALQNEAQLVAIEPRPRPALRVGGVGHRQIAAGQSAAIEKTLQTIFTIMEGAAAHARSKAPDAYTGPLDFAVVTPLAEGADRLISATASQHGLSLGVVLPFAMDDYEKTFDMDPDPAPAIAEFRRLIGLAGQGSGHGILVLDGEAATEPERTAAYRECATQLIRRSDFVIGIVERARLESESGLNLQDALSRHVPVILIHPEGPGRFRLILAGAAVSESADMEALLRAEVERVIAACSPPDDEDERCLRDYCAERLDVIEQPDGKWAFASPFRADTVATILISWCSGLNGRLSALLRRLLGHARRGTPAEAPEPAIAALRFSARTAAAFANLTAQFYRADEAAKAYAELQRSSHVLLAFLGTLIAILSSIDLVFGPAVRVVSIVIVPVLLYAGAIVVLSHRQRWLERWIDYRLLAEILRAGTFLLVAGETAPFDVSGPVSPDDDTRGWVRGFVGGIFRAQKLAVPGRELDVDPLAVEKARQFINDSYTSGQIDYHARTARYERRIGNVLGSASRTVTVLIGLVAVANVALKYAAGDSDASHITEKFLAIFLIFLPALAAVLVALRGYNQYEVVAQRSAKMAAMLAKHLEQSAAATSLRALGAHTLAASRIILHDVEGWTDIFASKHLEF